MKETTQDMLKLLREAQLGNVQTSYIMQQVRKELERDEWKYKFPILRFYCDWCAHSRIDRNTHCETIIRELNQCLWQLDENGDSNPLLQMNTTKFLRIHRLCEELGVVLSALSGEVVYPTLAFVYALFTYLKEVPIQPTEEKGNLIKGKPAYNRLCADLRISTDRPLMKSIEILDFEDSLLVYQIELDGELSIVQGQVIFPVCNDTPFVFPAERKNEEKFGELVSVANDLFLRKQLDDASTVLSKAESMLPEIRGMEKQKEMLYRLRLDVEWSRTGELAVLENGEKAMEYISEPVECSALYCVMSMYALQRVNQLPDALDKAKEYIEKSLELVEVEKAKARPMHINGRILAVSGSVDEALDAFTEAARYAEESHLEAEHALIRCDMAQLLETMGHQQMALAEFTYAENLAKDSADPIVLASCAFRKAQYLIKMGDKETACQLIASMPQII